jgi:hypothetical protein
MADDLNLNSISRFSKRSPRLHLEEHGHCEVPAGCGGVVLRWYNPARGVPILLKAYWPTAPAAILLNGVAPASSRPLVPLGRVVLTIHYDSTQASAGWRLWWPVRSAGQALLMFAISRPESDSHSMTDGSHFIARSAPDGSWRFSVTRPSDAWVLPDFDAAAWPELVVRPLDPPKEEDHRQSYAFRKLTEIGARPLGLPFSHTGPAWVRKVFTLEQEAVP